MHLRQLVEVFCGRAALSRAFEENDLIAYRFDCRRRPSQNIHTKEGALEVCEALVETDPTGSLAVFEPVCASWIFISLGSTLRAVEAHFKSEIFKVCFFSVL